MKPIESEIDDLKQAVAELSIALSEKGGFSFWILHRLPPRWRWFFDPYNEEATDMADMSEKIMDLERRVERHSEAIENLEKWQAKQNGNLAKIDDRLHSLERWIMATLATAVVSLLIQLLMRG